MEEEACTLGQGKAMVWGREMYIFLRQERAKVQGGEVNCLQQDKAVVWGRERTLS